MRMINLNADMGESYGRYTLGDDKGMAPYVASVNIACGFHAADPGTIHNSIKLAKAHSLEVGAHISYPDFMGFGRRKMGLSEREVFEISVYQIGAVQAFCHAEGVRLNHVKPHGELYLTAVQDRLIARGIVRAMKAVAPDLLLLMAGPLVAAECAEAGIEMLNEAYVDLDYNADGTLFLDRERAARDPSVVADNALSLVELKGRKTLGGSWLPIATETICLHSDMANGVELARTVHATLQKAGYKISTTRDMLRQRATKAA
jgi:5-oxoprolinase (ATP-hydrolysing) subunit A